MNWSYEPKAGLESDFFSIKLNENRALHQKNLNFDLKLNRGRNRSEDYYQNLPFGLGDIRLIYNDFDKLDEIEVLRGCVVFKNVKIKIDHEIQPILEALGESNFVPSQISFTDFENLIDIGDASLNGGDERLVCWFYTGNNFDHLK